MYHGQRFGTGSTRTLPFPSHHAGAPFFSFFLLSRRHEVRRLVGPDRLGDEIDLDLGSVLDSEIASPFSPFFSSLPLSRRTPLARCASIERTRVVFSGPPLLLFLFFPPRCRSGTRSGAMGVGTEKGKGDVAANGRISPSDRAFFSFFFPFSLFSTRRPRAQHLVRECHSCRDFFFSL